MKWDKLAVVNEVVELMSFEWRLISTSYISTSAGRTKLTPISAVIEFDRWMFNNRKELKKRSERKPGDRKL